MESEAMYLDLSRIAERFRELSAGGAAVERISRSGCDCHDGGLTPVLPKFFPQVRHV